MMLKIKDLVQQCSIEEIAHSASQICRWRGRFSWISLGEHLCNVFDIIDKKEHIDTRRLALLHDVCEVLGFGDVISPLKDYVTIFHDNTSSTLRKFEERLTQEIMLREFNVDYSIQGVWEFDKQQVKNADKISLELEKIYNGHDAKQNSLEKTAVRIQGWGPKRAKEEFLLRYESVK